MIDVHDFNPRDPTGWKELPFAVAPAISLTAAPLIVFEPSYDYQVVGVRSYARAKAGAVTARVYNARADDVLGAVGLAVEAGAPKTEVEVGTFAYRVGGLVKTKAAATDLPFSAAHVVTMDKWGAILVQINAAGAVSTKVIASPQAFNSQAAAVEGLPAADAGNVAIGYVVLQANVGANWTAQTDDLVAASDVQAVAFVSFTADAELLAAPLDFTALTEVKPSLLTAAVTQRGGRTDALVVTFTTDGTGALTDGKVVLIIRPSPMGGEVLPVQPQFS